MEHDDVMEFAVSQVVLRGGQSMRGAHVHIVTKGPFHITAPLTMSASLMLLKCAFEAMCVERLGGSASLACRAILFMP